MNQGDGQIQTVVGEFVLRIGTTKNKQQQSDSFFFCKPIQVQDYILQTKETYLIYGT